MLFDHRPLTTVDTYRQPVNRFESPAQFLNFCRTLGVKGAHFGGNAASWYGNETSEECHRYAITGKPNVTAEIDSYFAKFHRLQQLELQTSCWAPAPYGAYPVVGDYLAGSPESMRRVQRREMDLTAIRLFVDSTSSAGVGAHQLWKRGLTVAAFARALAAIRPVELYDVVTGDGYEGASAAIILLPANPMDLNICAWALGSQRLTRGFGYDFIRAASGFSGGWPWNEYNHHRVTQQMRDFIGMNDQDVYIPPINLDDALIRNPYEWLDTQLKTYLPEIQNET